MIEIPQSLLAVLQREVISSFHLVKVGTMNRTTYPVDLTAPSGVYISDGTLVGVEYPKMTSVVDKQRFKLTYSDLELSFAQAAETNLVGQPVEVWMGFEDLELGRPLLGANELLLIYKGTVDAPSHQIQTEDSGSTTMALDCASPMASLDRVSTYYTSQDYADANFPGDTSYERLFVGSGNIVMRWGK